MWNALKYPLLSFAMENFGRNDRLRIGGAMNKLFVFIISLLLLIPLARTAFAAPAAPGVPAQVIRLPVKGTMESAETYSNIYPTMLVTATGSGEASQLGRFALSYKVEWNRMDQSTTGTAYFVT